MLVPQKKKGDTSSAVASSCCSGPCGAGGAGGGPSMLHSTSRPVATQLMSVVASSLPCCSAVAGCGLLLLLLLLRWTLPLARWRRNESRGEVSCAASAGRCCCGGPRAAARAGCAQRSRASILLRAAAPGDARRGGWRFARCVAKCTACGGARSARSGATRGQSAGDGESRATAAASARRVCGCAVAGASGGLTCISFTSGLTFLPACAIARLCAPLPTGASLLRPTTTCPAAIQHARGARTHTQRTHARPPRQPSKPATQRAFGERERRPPPRALARRFGRHRCPRSQHPLRRSARRGRR
jgi:hypothetical protein